MLSFFLFGYFWKKMEKFFINSEYTKVKKCVGIEVMKYFEGIIEIHMSVDSKNNSKYFLTKFTDPEYKEEVKEYYK